MIILFFIIFFKSYAKEIETFVSGRKFFYKNELYILKKKLYPGRYLLNVDILKKGNVNVCKIKSLKYLDKYRRILRERVYYNTLYLHSDTRRLILSLILNERVKERDIYRIGLGHFLAISGLHFNFLFQLLEFFLLAFLPYSLASIINISLLTLYLSILRTVSSFRAYIFLFAKVLANILGEERSGIKVFIISLLLCSYMFGLKSIALHLSFTASFVLMFIAPLSNTIVTSIVVTFAMVIPVAYFFKTIPLFSIFSNLLFSHAFFVLIFLSYLLVLLPFHLAKPLSFFFACLAKLLFKIFEILAKFSITLKVNIDLSVLILYYITLVFLAIFIKKRRRKEENKRLDLWK